MTYFFKCFIRLSDLPLEWKVAYILPNCIKRKQKHTTYKHRVTNSFSRLEDIILKRIENEQKIV